MVLNCSKQVVAAEADRDRRVREHALEPGRVPAHGQGLVQPRAAGSALLTPPCLFCTENRE
jgi:hypothetical protein